MLLLFTVCLFLNIILSKVCTGKNTEKEFRIPKRLGTNILISLGLSFLTYKVWRLVALDGLEDFLRYL